jgi:GNAT superfamily N-acetyltransferase
MTERAVRVVAGPFSDAQIAAVARMHATEVRDGFLASLGEPALRMLYRNLATSPRCALFLAVGGQGEPVGFICGTRDLGALYGEFLRAHWPAAVRVLLPRLLSPGRIRRAIETLRYPAATGPTLPSAEIVNFVVLPGHRGQGVATRLFDELTRWFEAHGEIALKIVTGERQERAHGFYEKAGALLQGRTSIHRGVASRVYLYPIKSTESRP